MQTLILGYKGCILFEVIHAASFLDPEMPVRVATPDGEGFRDRSGVWNRNRQVSSGTRGLIYPHRAASDASDP